MERVLENIFIYIYIYFFFITRLIRSRDAQYPVSSSDISPFNIGIADTLLGHIGFFHFVNVYFCFRHASITDGAFVAESGRSIHGSSASVLGEAAQYRTEGRIRLLKRLLNYIHFRITSGQLRTRMTPRDIDLSCYQDLAMVVTISENNDNDNVLFNNNYISIFRDNINLEV